MPDFAFLCAAFHLSDDVFTDEAYGFLQVAGEVVEGGKGHYAGGKVRYGEMEVDDFSFLDDFLFKACDELLLLFVGLPVDFIGDLHGKGDLSLGSVLRIVVQHLFLDGKFPLHFTEPFQFVLYHLRLSLLRCK